MGVISLYFHITYCGTPCSIVCHICGNFDPQMWYSIPHMWYTQIIFFLDFDNDSYAQNSEIILTIRIQKNFFKIPIGKFFEKLSKSKKKNLCVPHMWYTIPHLWVKVTTYVVYYTTYVVYYTTNVYSPEIPILLYQ